MNVRDINFSDINELHKLFPHKNIQEIEESVNNSLQKIWNEEGERIIVEEGNEIIGQCEMIYGKEKQAHTAIAESLFVHENWRRKGIGTEMLKHLEKKARARKVELIILKVSEDNTPAIRLYEELGYAVYGRLEEGLKENGKYENVIYMKKTID